MGNTIIYNGNSLDYLKSLDDESVQLIITSPPYANQRKNNYESIHEKDYVQWFLEYTKEMQRVLKKDGSFVLNIKEHTVDGQKSLYVMKLVLSMVEEQGWRFVDEYIWHKTTAVPGKWNNRFRNAWEHCYHFAKEPKFVMNQDAVKVPIGDWAESRLKNINKNTVKRKSNTGSNYNAKESAFLDRKMVYPTNVLYGAGETTNKKHPAVYPLWLPEWFIKLFSNENDIVLDPFMGSGTTALACLNLKRKSIGAELKEEYIEVYKERILSQYPNTNINIIKN